jgi:adenylate kinase family enzyme
MVIGPGGSGKSTLARRLGGATCLPVIHLDREFWHIGWIPTPKDEWLTKVEGFAAGEEWIIDGNYRGTMEARWMRADLVIFLDFCPLICVWRAIRRRPEQRADMLDGMIEQPFFSKGYFEFLAWMFNFRRRHRLPILALREKYIDTPFVRVRNQRELEDFLLTFKIE